MCSNHKFKNFATFHSHPSSFDSGSTPEKMANRALDLGTGSFCVTDHGTLAASRLVYRLSEQKSLTPILGLEAYVRDDSCKILSDSGILKDENESFRGYANYFHLTMHSLDQEAFEFMIKKLSKANKTAERHGIEYKPIFNWTDIEELGSHNITMGSSCLAGVVSKHLLNNRPDIAVKYYEKMRSSVKKGNWYVELMPHDCSRNWVNAVNFEFSPSKLGIIEDNRNYSSSKNLRLDWGGTIEENKSAIFAERFNALIQKGNPIPSIYLVAVKNYNTWTDEADPLPISNIKTIEDFIQNECRPWSPDGDVQAGANRFVMMLAKKFGDPIVVSDDSHFSVPEEKIVQDVRLFSMENEKTKGNAAKWRFYGSYHMKTSDEAYDHFSKTIGLDAKTFESWVQNNSDWSSRFGWKFKDRRSLPVDFYPKNTLAHTIELINKVGRMDWNDEDRKARLSSEIKMLHKNKVTDLLPYLFIDQEVCQLYENNGMLTGAGRGSAAGLSLAYYLGITHVDPLKYGLSKERFLTESRINTGKLPDIDQDLPNHELLISETDPTKGWLHDRFGENFARISTNTQLRLRSTVQDVSRVMHGKVLPEIFQLTQKFPKPPQGLKDYDFVFGYENSDGEFVKGIIETDINLKKYIERYPEEWEIVKSSLGLVKNKSQHACAFVIANEPVGNFIPTFKLSNGVTLTEYVNSTEDPSVEESGGIKMDFLRLSTLNDIQGAIKLIQKKIGYEPKDERINGIRVPGIRVIPDKNGKLHDIWDLPEDQGVFADICNGDTVSVFQFGTPGARKNLKNFMVDGKHTLKSIEHISAFTALDRKGPLEAYVQSEYGGLKRNMLEEFAARSRGEKPIGNFPLLDEMFPDTFGILCFQENLQKTFQVIGGTTAEAGEDFRQHVSKKKKEAVMKDKKIFMPGAIEKLGEKEANRLYATMESWAGYGFNKSHAVCYAITGYACAWLKHHYPLEWWTSVLRNSNREKIDEKLWVTCKNYILTPDVKTSEEDFSVEYQGSKGFIRAPLRLLAGVGDKAHAELVSGRPYNDLLDFIQKIYDRKVKSGSVTQVTKKVRVLKRDQVDGGPKERIVTVEKVKLGRTALNSSVLTKLIISGTMDSLFPENCQSIFDKLTLFAKVWAEVHNLRDRAGNLKVVPVDSSLNNLTALQIFLLRKSILTSYSDDLASLTSNLNDAHFFTEGDKYVWRSPNPYDSERLIPVVKGDIARGIMGSESPDGYAIPERFKFGVVAYINDVEFFWNNKALRISYEVDGERLTSVKWPGRDSNGDSIPIKLDPNFKNSVSLLSLVRWNANKDFAIDDIMIIEKPINLKTLGNEND